MTETAGAPLFITGVSRDAQHQPGKLAPGVSMSWSAAAGAHKGVLLVASEGTVGAQLELMSGWFEARAHTDLLWVETMLSDRLECLRGKRVRFRGNPATDLGQPINAEVTLARFDEVVPGDTVWCRDAGAFQVTDTSTAGNDTALHGAADMRADASKYMLLAVTAQDLSTIVGRRKLAGGGQEAWSVSVREPVRVHAHEPVF